MTSGKKTTGPTAGGGSKTASGCVTPCPASGPDPWLRDALAIMCPKDRAFLDDLRARGVTITAFDRIYFEDPIYDGTKWTTKHFEAGGTTSGKDISLVLKPVDKNGVVHEMTPAAVAETIYHEGVHTGQPSTMQWSEKEYEAYTKSEQWTIDHGLPGRPGFRTTDGTGKSVPDTKAIREFVDKKYPIAVDKPATPGGPVYKVIGKDASGNSIIQNINDPTDVKTRKPKKGDTFPGDAIEEPPGGRKVKPEDLKCP